MSTPAAQALSGTTAAPAAGTGGSAAPGGAPAVAPGAGGAGAGPAGGSASNQPFFDSWLPAAVPENKDTRDWLANKNFADPATLVKSYRAIETEASTLRSAANLKAYPADKLNADGTVTKADPNAVQAWRSTMGVPEAADKYEITAPKDSPYPQFTEYLKGVMHEAGVPAAMAPALAKGYEAAVVKLETELRQAEDTKSAADLKQLEMEWGANYKERVALGARGKEWLSKEVGGLNDMQLRTLESVLGTTKFMTAMWKFGAGNTEASFAGGSGGGSGFEGGASAAKAEFDQLWADRSAGKISNFQWNDPNAVKHRDDLVAQIANGNANTN